jgi:hypothetical protein
VNFPKIPDRKEKALREVLNDLLFHQLIRISFPQCCQDCSLCCGPLFINAPLFLVYAEKAEALRTQRLDTKADSHFQEFTLENANLLSRLWTFK